MKWLIKYFLSDDPLEIDGKTGRLLSGNPDILYWDGEKLTPKKRKAFKFASEHGARAFYWKMDNNNTMIARLFPDRWRYGFIEKA